jgi:hypothetical protein
MSGTKGRSGGARPNTGGARPNSGPKRPPNLPAIEGQSPLDFLVDVMRNPDASTHLRLRAAIAAARYMHAQEGDEDDC